MNTMNTRTVNVRLSGEPQNGYREVSGCNGRYGYGYVHREERTEDGEDGEDGRESGKRCMVAWMVCERASVRDGALEIVHIN